MVVIKRKTDLYLEKVRKDLNLLETEGENKRIHQSMDKIKPSL